ncbi:flagellar hook-associated protein FlgL [Candidatus Poribacteria bacterium]|nr:flagellar hook-associated protein FlgL [Candidatus Poribacteria bacterium]
MGVTNQMLVNNIKYNIKNNLKSLSKIQDMLSTGKRINKPSDDPNAIVNIIKQNTNLNDNQQYVNNINLAKANLNQTETVLNTSEEILVRLKELALSGANATMNSNDRAVLAEEVNGLREDLLKLANTNFDGRYIFSGQKTKTEAFDSNGVFQGDTETIYKQIGKNNYLEISLPGEAVFNSNGYDTFGAITDLVTALENDNVNSIDDIVGELNGARENISNARTKIGVWTRRAEMNNAELENAQLDINKIISSLEDVDMASAIMDFKAQQYIYEASLATSGNILMKSLINYLG